MTLAKPIVTDDGNITEAVSEIDWSADSAAAGIPPGQFQEFVIIAGQLPDVPSLTFKAIQTYSDRTRVAWIETEAPGSHADMEHPAPVLTLTPAAAVSGSAASSGGSSTMPMASNSNAASKGATTTGIVLGAVGAVLGAVALGLVVLRRRTPAVHD